MPKQAHPRNNGSPSERTDALMTEMVRHLDEVTGALEGLAQALDCGEELPVALHRCCEQAIHAVPGADLASIIVIQGANNYHTAAATSDHTIEIDQAQYEAGQGPCLEAADTGQLVRVTVADVAQRWPEFSQAAEAAEVLSYLSAPLFLDREYRGSLNLYGFAPHAFDELDAKLLELYTTAAEAALQAERRHLAARQHTEQLRQALDSRAVIDQAKGIIMAARRIDADAAFTLLVKRSQRENRKIRDLAAQFVADLTERGASHAGHD